MRSKLHSLQSCSNGTRNEGRQEVPAERAAVLGEAASHAARGQATTLIGLSGAEPPISWSSRQCLLIAISVPPGEVAPCLLSCHTRDRDPTQWPPPAAHPRNCSRSRRSAAGVPPEQRSLGLSASEESEESERLCQEGSQLGAPAAVQPGPWLPWRPQRSSSVRPWRRADPGGDGSVQVTLSATQDDHLQACARLHRVAFPTCCSWWVHGCRWPMAAPRRQRWRG